MRRNQKMTIKEAYKKFNVIDIQFSWETPCSWCRNYVYEYDEEYSLAGTQEEFLENYGDGGSYEGVLSLDDEISYISDGFEAVPFFRHCKEGHEPVVCNLCCDLGLENCLPND